MYNGTYSFLDSISKTGTGTFAKIILKNLKIIIPFKLHKLLLFLFKHTEYQSLNCLKWFISLFSSNIIFTKPCLFILCYFLIAKLFFMSVRMSAILVGIGDFLDCFLR